MCKVTVSRMRERYAQTVLTFQITYVYVSFLPDDPQTVCENFANVKNVNITNTPNCLCDLTYSLSNFIFTLPFKPLHFNLFIFLIYSKLFYLINPCGRIAEGREKRQWTAQRDLKGLPEYRTDNFQ